MVGVVPAEHYQNIFIQGAMLAPRCQSLGTVVWWKMVENGKSVLKFCLMTWAKRRFAQAQRNVSSHPPPTVVVQPETKIQAIQCAPILFFRFPEGCR
jgi:hypothetical protein